MKWTYSIKNKLAASIALLALCALVLLSNYLDRIHTENVKNSISTMYEDRLIAEDYILKMTRNIYQIREILNADHDYASKAEAVRKLTEDLKSTYSIYLKTWLTKTEKIIASELTGHINEFERAKLDNRYDHKMHTDKMLSSLSRLSTVQLDESKLIMKQVESQYATIKASSQFAFAIVIIILVVLQIMVFSGESLIPPFKPKDPSLN